MVDGIVTRGGALPHWYMPGFAHFVTYRLFDTIPKARLQEMSQRRTARIKSPQSFGLPIKHSQQTAHKLFFREFDEALEANTNRRWLRQPEIAKIIRDNLHHHNRKLYELLAWCVITAY